MRLLIVGGKLQGTEAAYLAAKAGWDTVLVDRREAPPAAGVAHEHVQADITADEAVAKGLVTACDAVLPACEDEPTLAWLAERVPGVGRAAAVRPRRVPRQRVQAGVAAPLRGRWTCRGRASGRPAGSPSWSSPARPAAARAWSWRTTRKNWTPPASRWSRPATRSSSRSTWPARRSRSRCSPGAGAPCPSGHRTRVRRRYDCRRVVAPVGETAGQPAAAGPGGACAWDAAVSAGVLAALDAASVRVAEGLGLNGLMDVEVMVDGEDPSCSRSTPACPARRRRRCTGRAGSTSWNCCSRRCATRRRRRSTGRRAAPASTSTCAPREVCWTSSAST